MKKILQTAVVLFSIAVFSSDANAAVVAGDVISIDFGGIDPGITNWNKFTGPDTGTNYTLSASGLVRLSDGANTGASITVSGIDSSASGANIQGSGSMDSSIFSDHIQSFSGNDTLTFTISGLDDSLTYDLFGGFFRPSSAAAASQFGHSWVVGGVTQSNDFVAGVGVDGYESFTGVSSSGGVLSFTITDTLDAAHLRTSISELTITAVPEPSSFAMLALVSTAAVVRRRRK